jgi:hypothetical protein
MSEAFEEYARYFHADLRVEIGIRLPTRDIFREWGVVQEYHDDLIVVDLSRDQLPAGVTLDYGAILDVGVWVREQVYTCNAIIVEKKGVVTYVIQLLSSVTLKERREFFRIGVVLRVKYAFPPHDQTGNEVRVEWEKRAELEYLKHMDAGSDFVDSQLFFATHHHLRPSGSELQWMDNIGIPATICGGGVRFKLPRQLREGEMLNLEFHLPLKPMRIVHAVGEVVHVMEPVRSSGKSSIEYPTGMRFKWIDTRDRELIIQYISSEQLEQLRRLSSSLRYQEPAADDPPPLTWQQLLKRSIIALIIALLFYELTLYFIEYATSDNKSEIQSMYGQELGKYRLKRFIPDLPREK